MFKRLSLLSLLAVAACNTASVPLAPSQADAEGKKFNPPPAGQGALYVVRLGDAGTLFSVSVGPYGLGPIGNFTWFRTDVSPGALDVRCTGAENVRQLNVPIAAGETRFVKVRATSGWAAFRCSLEELDSSSGRAAVLEGERAQQAR